MWILLRIFKLNPEKNFITDFCRPFFPLLEFPQKYLFFLDQVSRQVCRSASSTSSNCNLISPLVRLLPPSLVRWPPPSPVMTPPVPVTGADKWRNQIAVAGSGAGRPTHLPRHLIEEKLGIFGETSKRGKKGLQKSIMNIIFRLGIKLQSEYLNLKRYTSCLYQY